MSNQDAKDVRIGKADHDRAVAVAKMFGQTLRESDVERSSVVPKGTPRYDR